MYTFHAGTLKQLDTVGNPVQFIKHHTPDSGLHNEFGTFYAGRSCTVQSGALGAIVASGHFSYSISLGMEHIRLCLARSFIFAYVFKAGRSAVEAIGNDHLIFHKNGSHFPSLAI